MHDNSGHDTAISLATAATAGGVAQLLERQSFASQTFLDLRLIYCRHVTTMWVKCPLYVNQPGQLSLPSLQSY